MGRIPVIEGAKIIYKKEIEEILYFQGKSFNVKKFFNRLRLPLWDRTYIPIYVLDNNIVAIGNYEISNEYEILNNQCFSFEIKK